jgi:uncharacterized phosphosugar-binding protein
MYFEQYGSIVLSLLGKILDKESESIGRAGSAVAETIRKDGLVHVFGCGHSHIIEEELFYRAGGLAAISPIFDTATMLHEGAVKSSMVERMSGYAPFVLERYDISPVDSFIVASTSGINPFPIEMASGAKDKGAKVIGISSSNYLEKRSRHPEGLHLPDVCDIFVDNHVPAGDATIQVRSDGTKAGPVSSIATVFIANAIMISACETLRKQGIEPEVYRSGNYEGGDEHNAVLISRYKARTKHL